jgi:hypothetical protein
MLLSKEIDELAADVGVESRDRAYVRRLLPDLAGDEPFWRVLVEMVVIALHRRGYVVVRRNGSSEAD